MRAVVESEALDDPAGAARRALDGGATEVVVSSTCRALDDRTLAALRALRRVRLRVTIATFDADVHARVVGAGQPGALVRSIARAGALGLPVDVVLPISAELGPVAGRLHGLARAAPAVRTYLLAAVPDGLPPHEPAEIFEQIASAVVAARELAVTLSTDDDTRVDTELQAVLGGIKPVIRLSTEGTDEATLLARYAGFGLVACAADGTFIDDHGEHGRRLRLVYVARSSEVAERVRDVEAKTFVPRASLAARAAEYRDLGLALGYPRCCVEAYVERVIVAPEGTRGRHWAEAFHAASSAWCAAPAWQLNHLLFECGDALITFTPCSYQCAAALDYASRVLARVESVSPLAAARLRTRLARSVAVDHLGARAFVELDGEAVVAARRRRTPSGSFVHPLDAALVRRLEAHREGGGKADEPAPVILRFAEKS